MRLVNELKKIRGKRVLVRVDFNVPIVYGEIGDDTRIRAALPTIEWLIKNGAKVILMTHFGRPGGRKESGIRSKELGIVAARLKGLLKKEVGMIVEWDMRTIDETVKKMKAGEVLMLPNLRLQAGEEKNNKNFALQLAKLADFYVNEAFSVCHRKHASVVGVPQLMPSYAGFMLVKEVETFENILKSPKQPLVVLMGGAKITDKIAMMQIMVKKASAVLVGGALASHFLKAMGYEVGASFIESGGVSLARKLLKNKKIILPLDVVVGLKDGEKVMVVEIEDRLAICSKPYAILDIGPKTILEFARYIKSAATLLWNGPMGLYEVKRFSHGTLALGRLFAARSKGRAFGVVGGGETIDALQKTGLMQDVDFISTGGGAMLQFMSGKPLPGIVVLN